MLLLAAAPSPSRNDPFAHGFAIRIGMNVAALLYIGITVSFSEYSSGTESSPCAF